MNALKRKRLALDLSQSQMAEKAGVSTSAYSAWEKGTRTPEAGYYGPLGKALKCSATEVVEMIADVQREKDEREKRELATAK